ncbi:hypothetical protein GCM10025738_25720 [Microbacterium fluvii]
MRRRILVVAITLIVIVLWAVAIASQSPLAPWFSLAAWALIAVAIVVRAVRAPRSTTRTVAKTYDQVQDIYLGRTQKTPFERRPDENSQIGSSLPSDPLQLPPQPRVGDRSDR